MAISHKKTIQYNKVDRKSRTVIQCREDFSGSRVHEIQVCTCCVQKWVIFLFFEGFHWSLLKLWHVTLTPVLVYDDGGDCVSFTIFVSFVRCVHFFFSNWIPICHKEAIQYNEANGKGRIPWQWINLEKPIVLVWWIRHRFASECREVSELILIMRSVSGVPWSFDMWPWPLLLFTMRVGIVYHWYFCLFFTMCSLCVFQW